MTKKVNLFRLSLFVVIPAVFLVSYKLYALVYPQQNNKCSQCHTEITSTSYSKMYIHRPMMDDNCIVCHQKEIAKNLKSRNKKTNKKTDKLPKGARLFARNSSPETSQWFQIPYNDAGNEVFVKILAGYRQRDIKKIKILPLDQLSSLENDGMPARISNIETTVERGIFITAQITWETDKPTKSRVSYSIGTRKTNAPREKNFRRTHKVKLAALKKNSLYQFTIHSTDMFDNRESSDVLTFSTENPQSGIRNTRTTARKQTGEINLTEKIFRNGDNLIFNLTSNQPVIMAMYVPMVKRGEKTSEVESPKLQGEHAHFRSQLDINNTICRSCHKNTKLSQSHPVNVFPKPGMTIPREYPTLADGRITCNTCHNKHASNFKYRTIKESRRELCIGCHKDYA